MTFRVEELHEAKHISSSPNMQHVTQLDDLTIHVTEYQQRRGRQQCASPRINFSITFVVSLRMQIHRPWNVPLGCESLRLELPSPSMTSKWTITYYGNSATRLFPRRPLSRCHFRRNGRRPCSRRTSFTHAKVGGSLLNSCLLYTSPSPRD